MLNAYLCCVPISMPGTPTLISSSMRAPKSRFISSGVVASCFQTPERSGLPSAVRGVGAVRLALPSAVRGVPGGTKFSHCACRVVESTTHTATDKRSLMNQRLQIGRLAQRLSSGVLAGDLRPGVLERDGPIEHRHVVAGVGIDAEVAEPLELIAAARHGCGE